MIRYLADENFDGKVVGGLRRRSQEVDILTVQEAGLSAAEDPDMLSWAAEQDRVILTHDVRTMTRFAIERIAQGLRMPGVLEVNRSLGRGRAIEQLLTIAIASFDGEYEGQIHYLPLF